MFHNKSFFLLMALIPMTTCFVLGIILYLIAKRDERAQNRERSDAETKVIDNINNTMDSVQESISKLREKTEKMKRQTEEISVLSQRLRDEALGNGTVTFSLPNERSVCSRSEL